ncbi:MAG TPA: type II toxin-antitoxin system HicA family toxin, partial [Armatimonadota bacterium]|nr:type II toxin-antitoxin system HicA family toxin [Armatimonadota bacterium]
MVAALKQAGFVERRQTGSHLILRHPGTRRMVVVPQHGGTMSADLTRSILRQA